MHINFSNFSPQIFYGIKILERVVKVMTSTSLYFNYVTASLTTRFRLLACRRRNWFLRFIFSANCNRHSCKIFVYWLKSIILSIISNPPISFNKKIPRSWYLNPQIYQWVRWSWSMGFWRVYYFTLRRFFLRSLFLFRWAIIFDSGTTLRRITFYSFLRSANDY